jgi:hypothetical protein
VNWSGSKCKGLWSMSFVGAGNIERRPFDCGSPLSRSLD